MPGEHEAAVRVMAEAMLNDPRLWNSSASTSELLREAWKTNAKRALHALIGAYPQVARAMEADDEK